MRAWVAGTLSAQCRIAPGAAHEFETQSEDWHSNAAGRALQVECRQCRIFPSFPTPTFDGFEISSVLHGWRAPR
eukprot:5271410-Pyramimonas_sp.AAC.1